MKRSLTIQSPFPSSTIISTALLLEVNMSSPGQNCVIPALVWYPPALINDSPVCSTNKDDSVPLVSFSYRIDATYQAPYSQCVISRPTVIEESKSVARKGEEAVHGKASAKTDHALSAPGFSSSQPAKDPFSPECLIPVPKVHGEHLLYYEPVFLRRRNERERQRVRCVNDGYMRLRQKLPTESTQKRMSKVDILRGAIKHIRSLQEILDMDSLQYPGNSFGKLLPARGSASRGSRPG